MISLFLVVSNHYVHYYKTNEEIWLQVSTRNHGSEISVAVCVVHVSE